MQKGVFLYCYNIVLYHYLRFGDGDLPLLLLPDREFLKKKKIKLGKINQINNKIKNRNLETFFLDGLTKAQSHPILFPSNSVPLNS
mgnify:CR=1 FL=1